MGFWQEIYIIKLARLLAHLRAVFPTWHTQDIQGSDYAYSLPIIEEPDRAMTQLNSLARGHALSKGRNYLTMDDVPLIVKVVLSTASIERVTIFDILLAHGGKLTTSEIERDLNASPPTARKTMTELKALGLVDRKEIEETYNGQRYHALQIDLKENFKWFLEDEFNKLREGFKPTATDTDDNDNTSTNDKDDQKISSSRGGNFFPEVSVSVCDTKEDLKKEKTPHIAKKITNYQNKSKSKTKSTSSISLMDQENTTVKTARQTETGFSWKKPIVLVLKNDGVR